MHAPHLTPDMVFSDATPMAKLLTVALIIASLAALAVLASKLRGARRLSGGSAFISGLRLGGPIIGGLGASYSLLMMTIGYANVGDVPLKVLAPGFAECFLQISLGFLAGAVAVLCQWVVESRIDRQVLGA